MEQRNTTPVTQRTGDKDNHLVVTWNHATQKFQVNVVGEATLAEAVGLLEFAKMELLASKNNEEEKLDEKPKKKEE